MGDAHRHVCVLLLPVTGIRCAFASYSEHTQLMACRCSYEYHFALFNRINRNSCANIEFRTHAVDVKVESHFSIKYGVRVFRGHFPTVKCHI